MKAVTVALPTYCPAANGGGLWRPLRRLAANGDSTRRPPDIWPPMEAVFGVRSDIWPPMKAVTGALPTVPPPL